MLKSTHIYHDAWADNGTATVSIHHTPYSVWLLGKLMLQLLLIDPQLSEKHWLIESWYNCYINDDQRTCGPLDTVETCFGSISNVRDFDVCFQCPWDFFFNALLIVHPNVLIVTDWHTMTVCDIVFTTICRCCLWNGYRGALC